MNKRELKKQLKQPPEMERLPDSGALWARIECALPDSPQASRSVRPRAALRPLVAGCVCLALMIGFVLLLTRGGLPALEPGSSPTTSTTFTTQTEATEPETPVAYGSLRFPDPPAEPAPTGSQGLGVIEIAGFTEAVTGRATLLVQGTVEDAWIREELASVFTESVTYRLRVERTLYTADGKEPAGETLLIDLPWIEGVDSVPVHPLEIGRTYLLPLMPSCFSSSDGSRYSLIYEFQPQIEITLDGEYIFPDTWTSLATTDSRPVETNAPDYGLYHLRLRSDSAFPGDLAAILIRNRYRCGIIP